MIQLANNPLSPMQHTIYHCAHTFNGKLNRSEIAKLLRGSASQRIKKLRSSAYFGRLADQKRKSIMHHLNVLIQQGLLEADVYGRISISNNHEN